MRGAPALGEKTQRTAPPRVARATAGVVGGDTGSDVACDARVEGPIGALDDVDEPDLHGRSLGYGLASSARFSSRTLTRASPRNPS